MNSRGRNLIVPAILLGVVLVGGIGFFMYRENMIEACIRDADAEFERLQLYLNNQVKEECARYPDGCLSIKDYSAERNQEVEKTYTNEWLPYCKEGHREFRKPTPPIVN